MNLTQYYLDIAETVAHGSKDPSTKVGCIIVSKDNKLISFGYNSFITGCDEKYMTFDRPQKHTLTVHAEMNALISAHQSIRDSTVYLTHASCANCLKHLIQAGVAKIVYKQSNTNGGFVSGDMIDIIERFVKSTNIIFENAEGVKFLDEVKK